MNKTPQQVRLIHNPNAGQKGFSKTTLGKLIKKQGFRVDYASSEKKSLKDIRPDTSFIAIAGGDGTIRKTIIRLLNKKLRLKRPIALLPMGTANNIATSLGISQNVTQNVSSWKHFNIRKFDIGQISSIAGTSFFLESFGFGIFPKLMKQMEDYQRPENASTEEELTYALDLLQQIATQYKAKKCTLEIEGKLIEDSFLLIEVMNISRLGPNLKLAVDADPGDGFFDVVMVRKNQRQSLCTFIENTINGKTSQFPIKPIRTKSMKVKWNGQDCHTDDQQISFLKNKKLSINLMHSLIEVIVGDDKLV
ncbi:diacylglycerol kinase [Pedobacter sp. G11]|uniref:diacylglycerol/lipid kinase family protein n=1 Tax=Pedobacter sp. G11 TaxID=2482728 RepID=UPI000F5E6021|nr:diacylglycerol kinase family protein [Pedobacter sp. G11]AZI26632.1 diacylglycerol kinase [Pedobacter sp. G11]